MRGNLDELLDSKGTDYTTRTSKRWLRPLEWAKHFIAI
jgi:hypothetical protein